MTWITVFTLAGSLIWSALSDHKTPANQSNVPSDPPYLNEGKTWVDSVMNSMSQDEKIGQLFMVAAYSNKDESHVKQIEDLIRNYHIGGLIFMQGGPVRQVILLNKYQEISKLPLLVAMDAEWSLSMRLDSVVFYPRQMMIAASCNENLVYRMGVEFARQLKRMGVHVSFSPVIDVNNNAMNPVINTRSFGENPEKVARLGWMYAKGLQDNHILAVAKHFPGHGDTNTDSHKDLPVMNHSRERLDSIELYPFRYCIRKGVGAVMIAHLYVPAIDTTKNVPTTLSKKVVTDLLRGELGFKGLIFTDAMNMQGVAKFYESGEAEYLALLAGNDILLFAGDVPKAINLIKQALTEGKLSQQDIDQRVRRILEAKYWAGLSEYKPVETAGLIEDLNSPDARLMQQQLVESSLTLVRNNENLIPLSVHDSVRIASVSLGTSGITVFQTRMDYYADVNHYVFNRDFSNLTKEKILEILDQFDVIVWACHNVNTKPQDNYGFSSTQMWLIQKLSETKKQVVDIFGSPYALAAFENRNLVSAFIASHNDWETTRDFSAQLIFGGIGTDARLPVSAGKSFHEGDGFTVKPIRLKFTRCPEEAGIDSRYLNAFDSVALSGVTNGAYPGCQVIGVRKGIVFYNRSFGYQTYDNKTPVTDFTVYDMASVTKIMASTLSIMKLYDEGKLRLEDSLSAYIPGLCNTDKSKITVKDAMMHQAKLTPWIPFYTRTTRTDSLRQVYYSAKFSKDFTLQVTEEMYLRGDYRDTIFDEIYKSPLLSKKEYRYSDLGLILCGEMISKIVGTSLDNYARECFYRPLGANYTCFNPLNYFDISRIAPTENDTIFRKKQVHGYVHDQAAAMFGGVAGHAGLFSNAIDMAKLCQMLLNKGEYGGVRYIQSSTIELFTKTDEKSPKNRRGIGFDKPIMSDRGSGPACKSASASSYGHSGFTGTYFWVDPEEDLVYVFISNRVYPIAENNKIISLGIRTNLHQLMYESIITDSVAQK